MYRYCWQFFILLIILGCVIMPVETDHPPGLEDNRMVVSKPVGMEGDVFTKPELTWYSNGEIDKQGETGRVLLTFYVAPAEAG